MNKDQFVPRDFDECETVRDICIYLASYNAANLSTWENTERWIRQGEFSRVMESLRRRQGDSDFERQESAIMASIRLYGYTEMKSGDKLALLSSRVTSQQIIYDVLDSLVSKEIATPVWHTLRNILSHYWYSSLPRTKYLVSDWVVSEGSWCHDHGLCKIIMEKE